MAIATSNIDECPGCGGAGLTLKEVYGVPVCDKCAPKCFSEKVRNKIKLTYERLSEKKRRETWNKRVELVKNGVKHFKAKNYLASLQNYREYLSLLETNRRVQPGGLHPALFDSKKEAGDIILLSGIFWDMVKIYDKMPGKTAEMQSFLNKYVEFSIGRPHIVLASETVRKYLRSDEVKNKVYIESAYNVIQNSMAKCFIATAVYGPDTDEVLILKNFRDQTLIHYYFGRKIISIYNLISPKLVVMAHTLNFPIKLLKRLLDLMVITIKRFNE